MENETTPETVTEAAPAEQYPWVCPEHPDKGPFKNKAAKAMHINRVHTKNIKVPRQGWRKNKPTPDQARKALQSESERLQRRRDYQKKLRARYKKEGKDSRGQLRPPGWKPRKSPRKYGAAWTPARRKRFQATWEAKKNNAPKPEFIPQRLEDPRAYINNCPDCGYNLIPHYLAAKVAHNLAAKVAQKYV